MLVPLVFLILPVTIAFALLPGAMVLRLGFWAITHDNEVVAHISLDLELDEEVDSAYVSLVGDIASGRAVRQVVVTDDRIRGDIVIDLDSFDNVLGIEFIGYKAMLG